MRSERMLYSAWLVLLLLAEGSAALVGYHLPRRALANIVWAGGGGGRGDGNPMRCHFIG